MTMGLNVQCNTGYGNKHMLPLCISLGRRWDDADSAAAADKELTALTQQLQQVTA